MNVNFSSLGVLLAILVLIGTIVLFLTGQLPAWTAAGFFLLALSRILP